MEDEKQTQDLLAKSSPIKRIGTPIQESNNQQQSQSVRINPQKRQQEYIVTNENPKAYKFPPSPTPNNLSSSPPRPELTNVNSYSAKYLQSLQKSQPQEYVDDIGPLLQGDELSDIKYIPIPVQEPVVFDKQEKGIQPHWINQKNQNNHQEKNNLTNNRYHNQYHNQQQHHHNRNNKHFQEISISIHIYHLLLHHHLI